MLVRVVRSESPFTFPLPVLDTYQLLEEVAVAGIAGRAGRLLLAYGRRRRTQIASFDFDRHSLPFALYLLHSKYSLETK